jgi:hypothetical protein
MCFCWLLRSLFFVFVFKCAGASFRFGDVAVRRCFFSGWKYAIDQTGLDIVDEGTVSLIPALLNLYNVSCGIR